MQRSLLITMLVALIAVAALSAFAFAQHAQLTKQQERLGKIDVQLLAQLAAMDSLDAWVSAESDARSALGKLVFAMSAERLAQPPCVWMDGARKSYCVVIQKEVERAIPGPGDVVITPEPNVFAIDPDDATQGAF